MSFFNIDMRLLTLMLLWFLCTSTTSQAAPTIKEVIAESASANKPTTILPDIDTEMQSKLQTAVEQSTNVAAVNDIVDDEAAAAVAVAASAEHMATDIVAPLTHIAHITYDSVPVTHKPDDHKPLFHRESHDELVSL
ncbi:PREDICTED: uncharacterized protein LOC108362810 isoform X1 [Rhagoletis zephyria]|uniref:uncharacterized protein LOC108362810 isoform X1 n=2 Tax=Rhagoletis zephyria TaxID=28612 RepID=UPI0008115AD9|nr:PREDICTED: uncharacterized protein LOC108362810 isoform X1 [Rhagoletis zephyria]